MQVGDKVRVVGSGNQYSYTQDGSEGIVTSLIGGVSEVRVRWDKINGPHQSRVGDEFVVWVRHLEVIEPVQQITDSSQLTLKYAGSSLSFKKNLVIHQTVDELLERFCKAYNLIMPRTARIESNLGAVYSLSAAIGDMTPGTNELVVVLIEEGTTSQEETSKDFEETTEDDGERVYKDTRTDAVSRAGITKDELDAVLEIIEAFEERKDLIKSFEDKLNAL